MKTYRYGKVNLKTRSEHYRFYLVYEIYPLQTLYPLGTQHSYDIRLAYILVSKYESS